LVAAWDLSKRRLYDVYAAKPACLIAQPLKLACFIYWLSAQGVYMDGL